MSTQAYCVNLVPGLGYVHLSSYPKPRRNSSLFSNTVSLVSLCSEMDATVLACRLPALPQVRRGFALCARLALHKKWATSTCRVRPRPRRTSVNITTQIKFYQRCSVHSSMARIEKLINLALQLTRCLSSRKLSPWH